MPRTPSQTEITDHVGTRSAKRMRWFGVEERTWHGNRIFAQVAGFQVEATLGKELASRCACLYQRRCDHVGALLFVWSQEPESFAQLSVHSLQLPTEPAALAEWLAAHDPVALDTTVMSLFGDRWVPRTSPLWRVMRLQLGEALAQMEPAPGALTPVLEELELRVAARIRRRKAIGEAKRWREHPPEEIALFELWQGCRRALRPEDLTVAPGWFGSVALNLDAEELEFRTRSVPHQNLVLPVSAHILEQVRSARKEVAGIVLDSIIGPRCPEVRAGVLEILQTPEWKRALARLDASLRRAGPKGEAMGWKLSAKHGRITQIQPVQLSPYKRRQGYRTKKLAITAVADLPTLADRAALGALKAAATTPFVLEHLVGHPRVVDQDGHLIRVRALPLGVVVQEQGGWRITLKLGDQEIPPAKLAAFQPQGGLAAVLLDRTAAVVEVGPVLEGLVGILQRFGGTFPEEAREPLTERLALLDMAVPLQLCGALQGTRVPADLRPLLRLIPLADGALRVEVRLRPLPGGPPVRPGIGAPEVSRVVDGARIFTARQISSEVHTVRQILKDLHLPALVDWDGTHETPDEALKLVWELQGRDDVVVHWPQRRLTVKGEIHAKQVRVVASRRRDWFGMEGEATLRKNTVTLGALLEAIRAGRQFVKISEDGWCKLTLGLQEALRDAATIATGGDTPRLPPLAAARALLTLEGSGAKVELPEDLVDLEDRIRRADDVVPYVPDGLDAALRPYQLDGLTWLRRLSTWAPGVVLADDMGLGKTLQALAFVLDRGGRTLVVAPASVNLNWQRECERFTPTVPIVLYRGKNRAALVERQGILVTSYELLVRDIHLLSTVRFETVIFDEAQALKNPNTKRTRSARALDVGFVLAMSGTPVENNLLELWSLMRVVAPGLLGPKEHLNSRFGRALIRGSELVGDGYLGRLVRPFLLRRTKAQVAPELPAREETVDWVEMSAVERVTYERLRLAAVSTLNASGDEPGRLQLLAALTRLRQAACSPRLIDPDAPAESSKLLRLCERVEEARSIGAQCLVFSQFTSLLDLAEAALARRGARLLRLDGSTPLLKRQAAVDAFQRREADVFLISLKAGGTGLTLTAATVVIHLDPWWNPAAEDQASDRAHRIGQTGQVQVIRLVSVGTVEEQVLALHAEKRALAAKVLAGSSSVHTMRSSQLLALIENR